MSSSRSELRPVQSTTLGFALQAIGKLAAAALQEPLVFPISRRRSLGKRAVHGLAQIRRPQLRHAARTPGRGGRCRHEGIGWAIETDMPSSSDLPLCEPCSARARRALGLLARCAHKRRLNPPPPVRIVAAHQIVVPSVDETLDLLRLMPSSRKVALVYRVKLVHRLAPRSPTAGSGSKPLDGIDQNRQGVGPSCGLGSVRRCHCLPRDFSELFSPSELKMGLAVRCYKRYFLSSIRMR